MIRWLIVVLLTLAGICSGVPAALAQSAPACRFVLGFRTLHALDPTDVGDCVDNQASAANGDALQQTTNGLLVWRKHPQAGTRNFTAFTNGYRTWINGPFGLEARLNDMRFAWEANPTGLPVVQDPIAQTETIGTSVQGRPITATRIGGGPLAIAFVGDTHGSPEAVTVTLMQTAVAYFREHPAEVPAGETAYFIPSLAPDGLADGTRLNADGVDLNRNWGTANWTASPVEPGDVAVAGDGGPRPFSEPETRAMRDFLLSRHVVASIFYHAPWGGIYAELHSVGFAQDLGQASGYPVHAPGDTPYPLTGTAHGWADANGERSVLLELHGGMGIEWQANYQAMTAPMRYVLVHAG